MSVDIGHMPAAPRQRAAPRRGTQGNRPGRWGVRVSGLHAAMYRLHLGWLAGTEFMLITHKGRKTGTLHSTIVLIVHHDPRTLESVVTAWGEQADWYRNILASPAVEVQVGSRKYKPEQRLVGTEELADMLVAHRKAHPIRARIQTLLLGWKWSTSRDEMLEVARSARGVAFRPAESVWW
ncbi:MAG TPA: nitroreductase family deazaflavin-dependent oxidoreductase [Chloroflexia bacterium]|nr:nitroreductase family deazaflavin-dependent oxidoreductase [Chloroflexia bacterium]